MCGGNRRITLAGVTSLVTSRQLSDLQAITPSDLDDSVRKSWCHTGLILADEPDATLISRLTALLRFIVGHCKHRLRCTASALSAKHCGSLRLISPRLSQRVRRLSLMMQMVLISITARPGAVSYQSSANILAKKAFLMARTPITFCSRHIGTLVVRVIVYYFQNMPRVRENSPCWWHFVVFVHPRYRQYPPWIKIETNGKRKNATARQNMRSHEDL
jgi:hypothetical protein